VALVVLLALIALASGAVAGAPVGAAPPATVPTPAAPERGDSATVADNDFIPQNVDLSACISANPRPGCGSENRAGWRQYLVLLALVIGIVVISLRIVASVRARDRSLSGH
jgi:hypothetical protein